MTGKGTIERLDAKFTIKCKTCCEFVFLVKVILNFDLFKRLVVISFYSTKNNLAENLKPKLLRLRVGLSDLILPDPRTL